MADFDVFNGDADGLCALHQLRLLEPREATLVTGPKRDIALLQRVSLESPPSAGQAPPPSAGQAPPPSAGERAPDRASETTSARITVLDISLDRNRQPLLALLAAGAQVLWFDHHEPGAIPDHPLLDARIDTDPTVCTSILVDRAAAGRYRRWAVCAAFGDGMPASAEALARELPAAMALDPAGLRALRRVGEALNYNAYAADTGTAVQSAVEIYRSLAGIVDPLLVADWPLITTLMQMSADDVAESLGGGPVLDLPQGTAWVLPATLAARRARGLIAQQLRSADPSRAVMIVAPDGNGFADVSIRCLGTDGRTASGLAARFDGGGGRAGAAGIDRISMARIDEVLAAFQAWFGDRGAVA